TAVDANRLVLVYHAYRLLAVEQGLHVGEGKGKKATPAPADAVPYGVYRDHWCRLVERTAKDTPQEGYALLAGLAAKCRAEFGEAVRNGLSREAVKDAVVQLVSQHAKAQAEAGKAAAAAAAEKARAEQEAAAKAAAELRAAQEAERKAQEAAKGKSDAEAV